MTKLRHYDNLGTARFITFSCYRRYPVLRQDFALSVVVEQLAAIRKEHNIQLLGYVLMPEHIHLVLNPPDGVRLGIDGWPTIPWWVGRLLTLSTQRCMFYNDDQIAAL